MPDESFVDPLSAFPTENADRRNSKQSSDGEQLSLGQIAAVKLGCFHLMLYISIEFLNAENDPLALI